MNPTTIIMAALGIALACSLAGNGLLASLYVDAREEVATQAAEKKQAIGAAMECSASIATLDAEATQRAAAALPALAAAQAKALSAEQRATDILSRPAAVPGNDCASADRVFVDWIQGRAKP
jgi:hypothetical protein